MAGGFVQVYRVCAIQRDGTCIDAVWCCAYRWKVGGVSVGEFV
jgi:hypothetical protein